jgi:hypothetical protein
VKLAAFMTVLGMDGMAIFTTADPTEIVLRSIVAEEAVKIAQQRDKALAIEIANAVGRLFK